MYKSSGDPKQQLAAVRMLFDWLVVGQVVPHNPAAAVRGPKYSIAKGKTHMPSREEAKALLAAIDISNLVGLRDRALIGVLLYTFARVSAATNMRVSDYYPVGKRWWLRLHEKGGKLHEMPVHHTLQAWLDAYIEAAGIGGDPRGPLFRTTEGQGERGRLTGEPIRREAVYTMIKRRARRRRDRHQDWLPFLAGEGDYGVSGEWRPARTCAADGGPLLGADDEAL